MNSKQSLGPIAIMCILFTSLFLVSGLGFKLMKKVVNRDEKRVIIKRLVTSSMSSFSLPLSYFSELMNVDNEGGLAITNKSLQKLEALILTSPVIKEVNLESSSGDLLIDYRVNYPVAELADIKNVVISSNGIMMPKNPFFPALRLTQVYLGLGQSIKYGQALSDLRLSTALEFLSQYKEELSQKGYEIEALDFSNYYCSSLGKRQVIVTLTKRDQKLYLRMKPPNFRDAFCRLYQAQHKFKGKEHTIDLRIENLLLYT
jgi:hypothetical protein